MGHEKELKDFLIYSYFGIVPKSIYDNKEKENPNDEYNDYCVKKVIIKAYSDATNQGAYNMLFDKKIPNIEELHTFSDDAKNKSANYIFDELKRINEENSFDDEWHKNVCNELVNNYKEVSTDKEDFFSYGNAQKWVNMTIKYMWLLELLPDCVKEEDLHIPIDSYIIDKLWEDSNIRFPFDKENTKREFKYSQPSDYVKSWSKWDFENDYKPFRDSVNNSKKYTLEWENIEWIKQADKRKHKEKEEQYKKFFEEK